MVLTILALINIAILLFLFVGVIRHNYYKNLHNKNNR